MWNTSLLNVHNPPRSRPVRASLRRLSPARVRVVHGSEHQPVLDHPAVPRLRDRNSSGLTSRRSRRAAGLGGLWPGHDRDVGLDYCPAGFMQVSPSPGTRASRSPPAARTGWCCVASASTARAGVMGSARPRGRRSPSRTAISEIQHRGHPGRGRHRHAHRPHRYSRRRLLWHLGIAFVVVNITLTMVDTDASDVGNIGVHIIWCCSRSCQRFRDTGDHVPTTSETVLVSSLTTRERRPWR